MIYRFTESALGSLLEFDQSTAEKIQDFIEEAAKDEFYNHKSYSYSYDNHGRPWDKLDLKMEDLNHRVFFTKIESKFYILEIFHRDEIEYNKDLYNLLKELEKKLES